jgi:hypothetical protein
VGVKGGVELYLANAVAHAQQQQQRNSSHSGFSSTAKKPPNPQDPEALAEASSITITRGSFASDATIPCRNVADLSKAERHSLQARPETARIWRNKIRHFNNDACIAETENEG